MKKLLFILLLFSNVSQAQYYLLMKGNVGADLPPEPETLNYIVRVEAAGRILSTEEKADLNVLFASLKSAGFYDKIHDAGLLIWGVEAANEVPFKSGFDGFFVNPHDFIFANTGTTLKADASATWSRFTTPGIALDYMEPNNTHIGFYSRTAASILYAIDMGAANSINVDQLMLAARYGDGSNPDNAYADAYYGTGGARVHHPTSSDASGFFVNSRIGTSLYIGRNGGVLSSNNSIPLSGSGTVPTRPITLFALDASDIYSQVRGREYAFWTVGKGLTPAEFATYNNIIETFLDSRGIGVQ